MSSSAELIPYKPPRSTRPRIKRSSTQENPQMESNLTKSPRNRRSRSISLAAMDAEISPINGNVDGSSSSSSSKPRFSMPNKRRSRSKSKLIIPEEEEGINNLDTTGDAIPSTSSSNSSRRRSPRENPSKRFSSSRRALTKTSDSTRSLGGRNDDEVPDMDWATMSNHTKKDEGSTGSLKSVSESGSDSEASESNDNGSRGNSRHSTGNNTNNTGTGSSHSRKKEKPDMDWSVHSAAVAATPKAKPNPKKMRKSLSSNALVLAATSSSEAAKPIKRSGSNRELKIKNSPRRKFLASGNKGKASRMPAMSPLLQVMAMDASFHGSVPATGTTAVEAKKTIRAALKPTNRDATSSRNHLAKPRGSKKATVDTNTEVLNKSLHDEDSDDSDGSDLLGDASFGEESTEMESEDTTARGEQEQQRIPRVSRRHMKTQRAKSSDETDLKAIRLRRSEKGEQNQSAGALKRNFTADDLTMRRRKRAQNLTSPGSTRQLRAQVTSFDDTFAGVASDFGSRMDHLAHRSRVASEKSALSALITPRRTSRKVVVAKPVNLGHDTDHFGQPLMTTGSKGRKGGFWLDDDDDNDDDGHGNTNSLMSRSEHGAAGRRQSRHSALHRTGASTRSELVDTIATIDDEKDNNMSQSEHGALGRRQSRHSALHRTGASTRSELMDTTATNDDEEDATMHRSERSPRPRRSHKSPIPEMNTSRRRYRQPSLRVANADNAGEEEGDGSGTMDRSASRRSRSVRSLHDCPSEAGVQQRRQTKSNSLRSLKLMGNGDNESVDEFDDNGSIGSNSSARSTRNGKYGYSKNEARMCLSAVPSQPKQSVGLAALLYCKPLDLGGDGNSEEKEDNLLSEEERVSTNSPTSVTDVNALQQQPQESEEDQKVDKVQAKKDYWKAKLAAKAGGGQAAGAPRARRRNSIGV